MNWYLAAFKKYAVFGGRASRREYWTFVLVNLTITAMVGFAQVRFGNKGILGTFWLVFFFAIFVPAVALTVRRLHDTNRSGLWFLMGILPIANIILLIFMLQDSDPNENQYGTNPKGAAL
jgi:uncharacterized membrane protein YhaH (DUF805 family)